MRYIHNGLNKVKLLLLSRLSYIISDMNLSLTQQEIGEMIGAPKSTVSKIKNNNPVGISVDRLFIIADKCNLDYTVTIVNNKNKGKMYSLKLENIYNEGKFDSFNAANSKVKDILSDKTRQLSETSWRELTQLLSDPPAPTTALQTLMQRKKVDGKDEGKNHVLY